jgi:hypothetical protein
LVEDLEAVMEDLAEDMVDLEDLEVFTEEGDFMEVAWDGVEGDGVDTVMVYLGGGAPHIHMDIRTLVKEQETTWKVRNLTKR